MKLNQMKKQYILLSEEEKRIFIRELRYERNLLSEKNPRKEKKERKPTIFLTPEEKALMKTLGIKRTDIGKPLEEG